MLNSPRSPSSLSLHLILHSGQIGFMVCCKSAGPGAEPYDPRTARQPEPTAVASQNIPELRYYSHEVHAASFVLPKFAKQALAGSLNFQ